MRNSNGFLIVHSKIIQNCVEYFGIENDPFPLDESELSNFFDHKQLEQFEKQIVFAQANDIALLGLSLAEPYFSYCLNHGSGFRLLYLEICGEDSKYDPQLQATFAQKTNFLGYDVGECSGDYYSALLSDVICRPNLFQTPHIKRLNKFGLFDSFENAQSYLYERTILKRELPAIIFESGVMYIIKVYHVALYSNFRKKEQL